MYSFLQTVAIALSFSLLSAFALSHPQIPPPRGNAISGSGSFDRFDRYSIPSRGKKRGKGKRLTSDSSQRRRPDKSRPIDTRPADPRATDFHLREFPAPEPSLRPETEWNWNPTVSLKQ